MRVLVTTGASGGHIFPALSFIDALKDTHKGIETLLVVPKKNFLSQSQLKGYNLRYISITSITPRIDIKTLAAVFDFLKGSLESIFILFEFRPEAVVGFGSLYSIPLILFGWLFRIKTLIHEQNVIPGRANRLLAIFSDRVAISFPGSNNYFKRYANKTVLTGNPVRKELKIIDKNQALDFFGLDKNKFTILLTGGSQGSYNLNSGFLRAVSALRDKSKIQIIHLSGQKQEGFLRESYAGLGVVFRLFGFLKEMQYAYSAADFLIARAGATTISEAIIFRLPAVIVPYPFAYEHQLKNAEVLGNSGCAVIVDDRELKADKLSGILGDFMDNPDKLQRMRNNYDSISSCDANNLLAKEAASLAI